VARVGFKNISVTEYIKDVWTLTTETSVGIIMFFECQLNVQKVKLPEKC
jgi:hypothetical protein